MRAPRGMLAERLAGLGLLYGTPLLPADVAPDQAPPERPLVAVQLLPHRTAGRLADGARDKAALVEALVLLVWAEGPPSLSVRRALGRQISALGLPRSQARTLRAALQSPGGPRLLASRVRGR